MANRPKGTTRRTGKRIELRSVFLTKAQVETVDGIAGRKDWSRAKLCRKAIELVIERPDLLQAEATAAA